MKKLINWKLFFILLVACVVSSFLVMPYALDITSAETEMVPALGFLMAGIQNLVMFALVIFIGLLLSPKIGMGLPLLEKRLEGKSQAKELKAIILPSIGLGVLAGVLIVLASIPFNKLIPEFQNHDLSPVAWKAFLASFYGGIAEEVLLRLFLVSLLVWITFKIKKTADGKPTDVGIWISIVIASVVFGLGHLPATAQIVPLTGIVVTRAIVLNGIGGIVFGWLYWKKSLESAMIAHFSTDIVLHIITPAVLPFFS
jgi:uncharacterized membrane protein YedE/YeeE